MKHERRFYLELFEVHKLVNLYTIRFENEFYTEVEKFIKEFQGKSNFKNSLDKIFYWIDKIGESGALERYFRPESKIRDGVSAIPIEISNLRLYCLRISDNILILGNGGYKPKSKKKYNDDFHLNNCVTTLSSLDYYIKQRIKNGKINISYKTIKGDMAFYVRKGNTK